MASFLSGMRYVALCNQRTVFPSPTNCSPKGQSQTRTGEVLMMSEVNVETVTVLIFWPLKEDAFCVANNRSRDAVLVMVSWVPDKTKKKQKHKHNETKGCHKKKVSRFVIHLCFFLQEIKVGVDFVLFAKRSQRVCCICAQKQTNSHSTLCLFVVVLLFCYNPTIHQHVFQKCSGWCGVCTQFNSQPTKTQQVGHTLPPFFWKMPSE